MSMYTMRFILPKEEEEYKHAANGSAYFCALVSILEELRKIRKYGDVKELSIEAVEKLIREELSSRNLEGDF